MAITPLSLPTARAGLLLADWSSPVELEHTYSTAIVSSATTIAEERRTLRGKPARTLRGTVTALSRLGGERLRVALRRLATERQPWPLWQDARRVTVDAATSPAVPTDIYLDTTLARYYAGARVWVWDQVGGEATNVELLSVMAVYSDRITVASLQTARTAARSRVAPSIDLDLHLENSFTAITGYYHSAGLVLDEAPGVSGYPVLDTYPASGFATKSGVPILEISPDWALSVERGLMRSGYSQAIGRWMHRFGVGSTRDTVRFGLTLPTRAASWAAMRFFDALQGRARPFWVVAPEERFVYVGSGAGYIDVAPLDDFGDIDTINYIAVVSSTGAVPTLVQVTSKLNNGATWRMGFAGTPTIPTSIARISDAYLVRLAEDRWTERWLTDTICQIDVDAIELLNEKEAGATGVPTTF